LFTFRRTSSNLELVIDNDWCASLEKEPLPKTLDECGLGSANSDVSTSVPTVMYQLHFWKSQRPFSWVRMDLSQWRSQPEILGGRNV